MRQIFSDSVPSLEQIILTSIATNIWKKDSFLLMLNNLPEACLISKTKPEWARLKDAVSLILDNIELPKLFKNELINIFLNLGWQLLSWKNYHSDIIDEINVNILKKVRFTSQRRINIKKTAELFVMDTSIDKFQRYNLACFYCLEEYIDILWDQLGVEFDEIRAFARRQYSPLTFFWSLIKAQEFTYLEEIVRIFCITNTKNISTYAYAFIHAAKSGNEIATKYFYQKLPEEEKTNILLEITVNVSSYSFNDIVNEYYPIRFYPEVIMFLLSCMDQEQQNAIFQEHAIFILSAFITEPWINCCLKLLDNMSDLIGISENQNALCIMLKNKKISYKKLRRVILSLNREVLNRNMH